jgi:alginate O-acetyltransferase complex protein AlgJ
MPMLHHFGRLWLAIMGLLLLLPMFGAVLGSSAGRIAAEEFRTLAALPGLPKSGRDWKRFPGAMDGYLRDHFGFRQTMLDVHGWISRTALGRMGNAHVLLGEEGWMFYRGSFTLAQSAGRLVRTERVVRSAAFLDEFRVALRQRGIALVVAVPPNAASIYADKIRGWPLMTGRRTEYGEFVSLLQAAGITTVDLRPVLTSARSQGAVFLQHDTHWTGLGAIAAFNAIAQAAGHTDWHVDPAVALGAPTRVAGGDLARMLGVGGTVSEATRSFMPSRGSRRQFATDPDVVEMTPDRSAARTVLILGDSFTVYSFPHLLAGVGVRALWAAHDSCGFAWPLIEQLRPDEVWYLPNERAILCTDKNNRTILPAVPGIR